MGGLNFLFPFWKYNSECEVFGHMADTSSLQRDHPVFPCERLKWLIKLDVKWLVQGSQESSADRLCPSLSGLWRSAVLLRASLGLLGFPELRKLFVMDLVVGALTQGAVASWLIRGGITVGKMREVVSRVAEILTDS